jgi:hypothetical protein
MVVLAGLTCRNPRHSTSATVSAIAATPGWQVPSAAPEAAAALNR